MTKKNRTEELVSAGGVVYRVHDGTVEVALCGRADLTLWALPKGTPNDGESLEETALREAQEETGLQVQLEGPIDRINYWFVRSQDGTRCHKTVYFYLMRPTGGDLTLHDPEFDLVRWFPAEEALRTLTYPNEVRILEMALATVGQQRQHARTHAPR